MIPINIFNCCHLSRYLKTILHFSSCYDEREGAYFYASHSRYSAIQLCIGLFYLKTCKVAAQLLRPVMTQHAHATDKQMPATVQTETQNLQILLWNNGFLCFRNAFAWNVKCLCIDTNISLTNHLYIFLFILTHTTLHNSS